MITLWLAGTGSGRFRPGHGYNQSIITAATSDLVFSTNCVLFSVMLAYSGHLAGLCGLIVRGVAVSKATLGI